MSALYRRYRPQDFDQVVGQEHVVRTLRNAVDSGRVRHAYLFSGPRGTGKTSLAKILAKSLNCLEADGPTTTPCGRCESCRSIQDTTALDVIELDAASNRGIDDVRAIRDRVALRPALGRRKVYILDEAHSLTADASNALLKTLEEPPGHVVFVLCTTEPHKLLDTIKGRCQSFVFSRPGLAQLLEVLERVATAERIAADAEALVVIAHAARGSFRDAVSLLDQVTTALDGTVRAADVRALLGIVDEAMLTTLVDHVATGDAAAALTLVERLVRDGHDLAQVVSDLIGYLRMLVWWREVGQPPAAAALTPERLEVVEAQAGRIGQRLAVGLLDHLIAVENELREGGDVRLGLELALVRLARPETDPGMDAVLRRLERLEEGGGGIDVATARGAGQPPQPVTSAATAGASQSGADTAAPAASTPPTARLDAAASPATEADSADAGAAHDPAGATDAVENGELARVWNQRVIPAVRERKASLAPNLSPAIPVRVERGALVVEFPASAQFQRSFADTDTNRAIVAEAVAAALGQRLRIVFETRRDDAAAPAPTAAPEPVADSAAAPLDPEAMLLSRFRDEFDAHEMED